MAESARRDWASLPGHILDSILEKIVELSHYVWFSVVCKPWHSVALHQKHSRIGTQHKQIPLLLVPTKDQSHKKKSLYSITQNKIYNLQVHVPYNRRFCGSSHGWLIAVKENLEVTLINPFSERNICLPTLITRPNEEFDMTPGYKYEYEMQKVILSADPYSRPNECVVVAIYGGFDELAFIKLGGKSWTYVDCDYTLFMDVIAYRGQIYALQYDGALVSLSVTGDSDVGYHLRYVVPKSSEHPDKSYIVESSRGDLLLVRRYLETKDPYDQDFTVKFKVLRLQHPIDQTGQSVWVEVDSLRDDALFLGENHSLAISASDFHGCRPNCIYYTDDYNSCSSYLPFGPCDMGIYNLEDGSFGSHYILESKLKHMPPALWVSPTLK